MNRPRQHRVCGWRVCTSGLNVASALQLQLQLQLQAGGKGCPRAMVGMLGPARRAPDAAGPYRTSRRTLVALPQRSGRRTERSASCELRRPPSGLGAKLRITASHPPSAEPGARAHAAAQQRARARTVEARLASAPPGGRRGGLAAAAAAARRSSTGSITARRADASALLRRPPKWNFVLDANVRAPDTLRDLPRPLCRAGPRAKRPAPAPAPPPPDAPAEAAPAGETAAAETAAPAPAPDAVAEPEPEEPAARAVCPACGAEHDADDGHRCAPSPIPRRRPQTVSGVLMASRSAASLAHARRASSALPRARSTANLLRQCPRCMVLYAPNGFHQCPQ